MKYISKIFVVSALFLAACSNDPIKTADGNISTRKHQSSDVGPIESKPLSKWLPGTEAPSPGRIGSQKTYNKALGNAQKNTFRF